MDVQRGTWNIKDEYLSVAAQSNVKTLHSGVEGSNTPHRAKTFGATMQAKKRKQRTTNTPHNIVTTKQHTEHSTWGEAPVATWTRQPSGIVQGGGWVPTTVSSSNNLIMHSERYETTERQGDGQHLENKQIQMGNYITG